MSNEFIHKSEKDKELEIIERYYPGLDGLTADEVNIFAEFDSYHDYQVHIACRRIFPEKYNDNSKVIGASKAKKIEVKWAKFGPT